MRSFSRILLSLLIIIGVGIYLDVKDEEKGHQDNDNQMLLSENSLESSKQDKQTSAEEVFSWIGKNTTELKSILGKPTRIDPSYYGYKWWVYNNDIDSYIQVGVLNNKIVTIYANGPNLNISPFYIGQHYEDIYSTVLVESDVQFEHNDGSYHFKLTDEDLNTQPLIQLDNHFVQLYIDKFKGTLSSIRIMDADTLIKQRPYELIYRGKLVETKISETKEIALVEKAMEKQILDITNIIRKREKEKPLKWDTKTAEVAYLHSKDMYKSNTFSHQSKKYGDLSDRLDAGEVFYQAAGENIAANYIDGPAVVEGWLNSLGHRESLLNEKFTHIGVGVFQKYYTQNFIQKWD